MKINARRLRVGDKHSVYVTTVSCQCQLRKEEICLPKRGICGSQHLMSATREFSTVTDANKCERPRVETFSSRPKRPSHTFCPSLTLCKGDCALVNDVTPTF